MTTFPASPTASRRFASNSTTPTKPQTFRNGEDSFSVVGGFEGSPTSTLSFSATTTGTASSQGDAPQSSPHQTFAVTPVTSARPALASVEPPRQLYVRVDPALLTCFDPADKELYDLWAPKR